LSGATLLDDGALVVVGNGGSVVVSHDDGQTFSVFNRPDRISLSAVTAAGNGNLILVGQGVFVLLRQPAPNPQNNKKAGKE